MSDIVGGGAKKILYTLKTARRIGLKKSAKALLANNTCKACGLGMGGQRGGMTNELDEFPSVCNKSIQAQSTDIQDPIPKAIFAHSLDELRQLSAHQIEHLGRLNTPLYKAASDNKYTPIAWDEALAIAAKRFAATAPERSFFYSSGRSSNEAGFILQLMARLYGTNNVNNCSYYCHQATGVGLTSSIGSGTATIELADLAHCDVFFLIGANPASNHPRLIHKLKALRDRGGDVIVINPAKEPGLVKFAVPKSPMSLLKGGDAIASHYLQPNIGSDIWLIKALAKSVLESSNTATTFIENHTENFAAYESELKQLSWQSIEEHTGLTQHAIEEVAACYGRAKNTVFAWGMGITHHQNGCDNVEAIASLALIRGMIGRPGSGLLPLRGHSNVQGIGTIGVKPILAKDVLQALENELHVQLPKTPGLDTMACLHRAAEKRIDAALIMGGNLYEASPDTRWAKTSLDAIGFKLYLTTTLNKGHIYGMENSEALILPVTARDEEPQATTQESMFNYVRMSDGGIERLDNLRSESDILCDLANKIIPQSHIDFCHFKQHRNIRKIIAQCVPGMQSLRDIDTTKQEFHVEGRLLHSPVFNTESGRAKFISHTKISATTKTKKHPFTLMTIRSEGQFNTIIYEEHDSYRGVNDRWSLLMNADDMSVIGLQEGSLVHVRSDYGQMKSLKVKPFDLPPGNLMAYYPEANILVGQEIDPRSKTPAFKTILVSIDTSEIV